MVTFAKITSMIVKLILATKMEIVLMASCHLSAHVMKGFLVIFVK